MADFYEHARGQKTGRGDHKSLGQVDGGLVAAKALETGAGHAWDASSLLAGMFA